MRLAPIRFNPVPPALEDRRNAKQELGGLRLKSSTRDCRLADGVDPSRRKKGRDNDVSSVARRFNVDV
jgi:hypothetical protein